jgi:Pectate lyase superfamily protein
MPAVKTVSVFRTETCPYLECMDTWTRGADVSRRHVLTSLALGGTFILAACGASDDTGPDKSATAPGRPQEARSSASPQPTKRLNVTSFGAVGDGKTDDTSALKRALAAVRPGEALVLPAGRTFVHREVLSITTPGIFLLGPGALESAVEYASALKINAANVRVDGITLGIRTTTKRWSTPDQHKLFIGPFDGVIVENVTITGSAAAGLFCFGPSNFTLRRITVSDTRADGIHMTDGSTGGIVDSVLVERSGDDAVAVVSYLNDSGPCTNIRVTNVKVRTTTGGRGISVVGGTNVEYSDIDVMGSFAASVYIACEGGPSGTLPAQNVTVKNGKIRGANTSPRIDHGAVLIFSGRRGGAVRNVTVSGLKISATRATASRQIGIIADNNGALGDVKFIGLTLDSAPEPYQGNAPLPTYGLTGVTADGRPVVKSK